MLTRPDRIGTPPLLELPLLTLTLLLTLWRLKPGAGIPLPGMGMLLPGVGMPLMPAPRSYLVEKVPRLLGVRYAGS